MHFTSRRIVQAEMRFVVLHHEMPAEAERPTHWDLMLEQPATLWTWAVPVPPEEVTDSYVDRLADHRRKYLAYEGRVSGNRGTVSRWDEGTYRLTEQAPGVLLIEFAGRRLRGRRKLWLDPHAQRWRLSALLE